jgi:hypothetical protein
VYKLLFHCKNAAHPMYFDPQIDTLFLREIHHQRDTGEWVHTAHRASRFLRELPNKDQVQRLTVDICPAFSDPYRQTSHNPPAIFKFKNLKVLTLVKRVNADPKTCACICRSASVYTLKECDSSGTPVGRTHFLDMDELRNLGQWQCDRCTDVEDPLTRGAEQVLDVLEDFEAGSFGEQDWNEPVFDFAGALYDRIPKDQFWYKPKVEKVHNTRSWTARMALESFKTSCLTPQ